MTVKLLWLPMAALLFACEQASPPAGGGFAGLGQAVEGFSEVRPDPVFSFPADHGSHPDYRIEWWYVTANLVDEQGRDWGVQWTLFRQALQPQTPEEADASWDSAQAWLGHAAVTSATAHRHADRLARGGVGQAGAQAPPLEAWIDDWSLASEGDALERARVTARGEGFAYQLDLHSAKPLVLHGEGGYSRKSEGDQASYYYSQPFFEAVGEIEWEGKRHRVRGQAWLDREWSSQPLAADQRGWDWFSLHLDGGEKVMLFRLRSDAGENYFSGSWISAEGRQTPLSSEQIRMLPLAESSVAGRDIPTRWRLRIPDWGLDVTAEALNPDAWMGTGIPYWEGPVWLEGSHAGRGYLEMTGY